MSVTALARPREELREDRVVTPDGIHVLDGSYILDIGQLHMNITNHGLIGSQYTDFLPYSKAPSAEWPGGSGEEYLWGAGLWIGGRVNGQLAVTTGQPQRELRPASDIVATIYEARGGKVVRPRASDDLCGRRLPDALADDDGDGHIDEDPLNGRDDDHDGRIDEDFGQLAAQMFTCTMHDDVPLVRELYPDHMPLGLTVVQRAATWYQKDYQDIVIMEWEITNNGINVVQDVFLGMYVDCDIGRRDAPPQPDDLAGFYSGAMRDEKRVFHRVEVGWMRDANENDPLPGWFGTVLLGHDTDFMEYYAPRRVGVRTFQIFSTNARVEQQGEPLTDADRYAVMTATRNDPDQRPDASGDLKYLMTWGPFGNLPPGRSLKTQVAFVIGASKEEMLANALKAAIVFRGREFNLDNDELQWTGYFRRERMVCLGDYPSNANGSEPLLRRRVDFADEFCTGSDAVFGFELIQREDTFASEEGRRCIYVNADNCEECFRTFGQECTVANQLYWQISDARPPLDVFTGVGGRETRVNWLFPGLYPPPSPDLRLVPGNNAVELFWDDVSEHEPDYVTGQIDFESYRIYRVADWRNPPGTSGVSGPADVAWGLIDEYDIINEMPGGTQVGLTHIPLGRNTGLDVARYRPRCLDDPRFDGLAGIMQAFIDADPGNRIRSMPHLRDWRGAVVEGLEAFVPWETWPTVLDTFFAVTEREAADGVLPKRSVGYYHHRDGEVHNGFDTFYSVVPTDHLLTWDDATDTYLITGQGIGSEPGNNYQLTTPGPAPQTPDQRDRDGVNIYVYPNPATREALAQMQQQPPSLDNPTGVRVVFNNLPRAMNIIRIFTASGDLVQTLYHDGRIEVGAKSWDLMSRNGQEVVSGIYIYTVHSDDDRFEVFQGRFVLIR